MGVDDHKIRYRCEDYVASFVLLGQVKNLKKLSFDHIILFFKQEFFFGSPSYISHFMRSYADCSESTICFANYHFVSDCSCTDNH